MVKIIFGIILLLIMLHLLQRFLGFNIDQTLAQFNINLGLNNWLLNFNWLLGPLDNFIDQIISFFNSIIKPTK